jgi:hypothetical protein
LNPLHPGAVAAVKVRAEKAISYQPPSRARPGKDIDETRLSIELIKVRAAVS